MTPEERTLKYRKEHPVFDMYIRECLNEQKDKKINRLLRNEKSIARRVKVINEIVKLRVKNEKTLLEIGKILGVSSQRVHQRLSILKGLAFSDVNSPDELIKD